MSHRRRNTQKLCLSKGGTKIHKTMRAGNLQLLGVEEREKAEVVMLQIILLKGRGTETCIMQVSPWLYSCFHVRDFGSYNHKTSSGNKSCKIEIGFTS